MHNHTQTHTQTQTHYPQRLLGSTKFLLTLAT
jgi:hypothetical protein